VTSVTMLANINGPFHLEAVIISNAELYIENQAKQLGIEVDVDTESFYILGGRLQLMLETEFKTKSDAMLFRLRFSIEELNGEVKELDAYVEGTDWLYGDELEETL